MFKVIALSELHSNEFPGSAIDYTTPLVTGSKRPRDEDGMPIILEKLFGSPDVYSPIPPFGHGHVNTDRLTLPECTYDLGECIGSGGMATVVALKDTEFVIKIGYNLHNESHVMKQLESSKYVTRNLGDGDVKTLSDSISKDYILMKRGVCSGAIINQVATSILNKSDISPIVKCSFFSNLMLTMAKAIRDVHAQGLAHNDLKDINFVVFEGEPKLKLADFGTASPKTSRPISSTYFMLPPEEIISSLNVDNETHPRTYQHRDLFHLGFIVAKALLQGKLIYEVFPKIDIDGVSTSPFDVKGVREEFKSSANKFKQIKAFLSNVYNPRSTIDHFNYNEGLKQFSDYISDHYPYLNSIKPIILNLLSLDYRERPTASEVCQMLSDATTVLKGLPSISEKNLEFELQSVDDIWGALAQKERVISIARQQSSKNGLAGIRAENEKYFLQRFNEKEKEVTVPTLVDTELVDTKLDTKIDGSDQYGSAWAYRDIQCEDGSIRRIERVT